jgi:heme-degrading monooxygenase HmoA
MIVVSNRVTIPDVRVETFEERLRTGYGIEDRPGFHGMTVLAPVDAEGHITMTFWETREDYEAWRESTAFESAHQDASAERAFKNGNEVEIHEVAVDRTTTKSPVPVSEE